MYVCRWKRIKVENMHSNEKWKLEQTSSVKIELMKMHKGVHGNAVLSIFTLGNKLITIVSRWQEPCIWNVVGHSRKMCLEKGPLCRKISCSVSTLLGVSGMYCTYIYYSHYRCLNYNMSLVNWYYDPVCHDNMIQHSMMPSPSIAHSRSHRRRRLWLMFQQAASLARLNYAFMETMKSVPCFMTSSNSSPCPPAPTSPPAIFVLVPSPFITPTPSSTSSSFLHLQFPSTVIRWSLSFTSI